jgi:nucleoid DNA-binding protein
MIKSQLIDSVADDLKISRREAKAVVDSVLGSMCTGMIDDGHLALRGFGTFTVHHNSTRSSQSIDSRSSSVTDYRDTISFVAGSYLRQLIENRNQ